MPDLEGLPLIFVLALIGAIALLVGGAWGVWWLIENFDVVRVAR